ncbi:MAG: sigma-70 family RNA polymerase sigma factor [Deltaproteobacteria bacterium]|nr:sigma-70 family RNA polymerase sigma factor [Deltaproteobacteria bacterium]
MQTEVERNKLIQDHLGFVRGLAAKVRKETSPDLDFEELVAYGTRGLVEAAQRFDPSRGVAFTTFAYYRIRGAIYDGLRETGWLSRSEYARFQASTNELLENRVERKEGVAAEGQDAEGAVRAVAQTLDEVAAIFVVSLDASERTRDLPDPDAVDPTHALEGGQTSRAVRNAVASLPAKERQLIELYYFDDLTLEAAGQKLGLSKSWACRLHARAVKLLTEALGPAFSTP